MRMLQAYPEMPVERLITGRFSIDQAPAAFEQADRPEALKVLLECD